MRILVIGSLPKSLIAFRGHLLRTIVSKGHSVWACSNGSDPEVEMELASMGVKYCHVEVDRAGINPMADIATFLQLVKLLRKTRPHIVLSYTVKPVIYGGLAARFCKIPSIYSIITGLGHAFIDVPALRQRILRNVVRLLYTFSLRFSKKIFFQNPDDIDEFITLRITDRRRVVLTNGSGVDLRHYFAVPLPSDPVFVLVARLLKEKGVREYVDAAKHLKKKFPALKCLLVGDLDSNPSSIGIEELSKWREEGYIEYCGYEKDVRPVIAEAAVLVLPSYREGTPRSVLEAMAMGRPVIVSNTPGCRETIAMPAGTVLDRKSAEVIKGENGFLVPVKDVEKLAQAMEQLIISPSLRERMGESSRKFAEEKYAVNKINSILLQEMGL